MTAGCTKTRKGWVLACPACERPIVYTILTNWDAPVPFFYADASNDVLLRFSDRQRVESLGENPDLAVLEHLWNEILSSAPVAPSGGEFGLWTNVSCPHCGYEIPYNGGVRNLSIRIYEPRIVLVDGAVVVGDVDQETWVVRVDASTEADREERR